MRLGLPQLFPFALALACLPSLATARPIGPGLCGNSVIEPGETCDDGNIVDNDGCSSFCQVEGDGGAGFVPPPPGDGGAPPPPGDGGVRPPPPLLDADVPDGMTGPDASPPRDSGAVDTGAPSDGGEDTDGGIVPTNDAGRVDTGLPEPDSGVTDSGSRPDSTLQVFTPPPIVSGNPDEGCGCTSAESPIATAPAGLGLVLLGLFLARRSK